MKNIKVIKKAVQRKHPCDPVHNAIARIETNITDLIIAWNDLPDDIRLSKDLDQLSEIIIQIGDN